MTPIDEARALLSGPLANENSRYTRVLRALVEYAEEIQEEAGDIHFFHCGKCGQAWVCMRFCPACNPPSPFPNPTEISDSEGLISQLIYR